MSASCSEAEKLTGSRKVFYHTMRMEENKGFFFIYFLTKLPAPKLLQVSIDSGHMSQAKLLRDF